MTYSFLSKQSVISYFERLVTTAIAENASTVIVPPSAYCAALRAAPSVLAWRARPGDRYTPWFLSGAGKDWPVAFADERPPVMTKAMSPFGRGLTIGAERRAA